GLDADLSASCGTLIDIAPSRSSVLLRLACLTGLTVTLDAEAVDALVEALRTGDIRVVGAHHVQRGRVLLGTRPHLLPGRPAAEVDQGPMELELHLDHRRHIRIVFARPQVTELIGFLAEARARLAPSRSRTSTTKDIP